MATLVVRTVKTSGGDYTSLAAAEAGEQADLVSADVQLDIECYAMSDTTAVTINGWTTDATRYIRVFAATGQGHVGVYDAAKYRLHQAADFTYTLRISEEYVRLEGLQIAHTGAGGSAYSAIDVNSSGGGTSDIRLDRLIVYDSGASTPGAIQVEGGKVLIRNSAIYGGSNHGVYVVFAVSAPTANLENCTVTACTGYGLNNNSGTMTAKNCYVGGNSTDDYTGTITKTTCAHSSATSFTGSTASVAYSTANFANVTGGSEDLHLVSGSALIDAGTDLSGTFTTDIDGATRTGTWDIGADEFVSVGGQPAIKRMGGVQFNAGPFGSVQYVRGW